MKFETEYQLQQFREVEKEMFDENGKAFTGSRISERQSEEMLTLINSLETELKEMPSREQILQLLQDSSQQYGETYEQRAIFDSNFGELSDVIIKLIQH